MTGLELFDAAVGVFLLVMVGLMAATWNSIRKMNRLVDAAEREFQKLQRERGTKE